MFNLNQLKKLYGNSPLWMKKLYAAIPFDLRNGNEYRKWKNFLQKDISIEEYEYKKLKETVTYAYNNTVFYRQLFTKIQATPNDIKSIKDFQQIPFVDKDIVRENYEDFLVKGYPKNKILRVTTGGSSGTPVEYIQSRNIWSKELAFYMHFFRQFNYIPISIRASFKGGDFSKLSTDEYWFYNPVNNEINFSPTHITKDTIKKYVNQLNKIKPRFFYGYPSSMLFLMQNIRQNNLTLDFNIDAIFLISESFTKEDIDRISNFFNCSVASTYGHSERLVLAESNGKTVSNYSINRRYGYFELIDENESTIEDNNIRGEIIGTGFDNYAMPILRYKTGDFTAYENFDKNIINLVDSPRKQLYIDDKNNNQISEHALLRQSEMLELGIIKYQILQTVPGKIKLFILTEKSFDSNAYQKLVWSLKNRVNDSLEIEIIITDKLILTKRGKCMPLIKEY